MRLILVSALGVGVTLLPACSRRPAVDTIAADRTDVPAVTANVDSNAATSYETTTPAPPTETVVDRASAPPLPRPRVSSSENFALVPGSTVRVRLLQTVDTERNRAGDRFLATLDEPLVSGDRVIVPKGTKFSGHITESKRSGRVKGRAMLALSLDSFEMNGRTYLVRTSPAARVSGGHKKRNWLWLGGGSAGGALIGAAASGGTGALIGGGAGAAAGTVGMLFTGRKDVRLPVEAAVTFTIQARTNLS